MKVRGAVLRKMGRATPYAQSKPLSIETLDLEGPARTNYACACLRLGCVTPIFR